MKFIKMIKRLGLTARLGVNEPNCRVKPVQIDGNYDTSPLSVTLFVEEGDILGVAVTDLDNDLALIANVGETWDDEDELLTTLSTPTQPEYTFPAMDALTGERMGGAGWTVTRRIDGEAKHFESLSGVLTALNEGTFGVKIVAPCVKCSEPLCPGPCPGCSDPICSAPRAYGSTSFADTPGPVRYIDEVSWPQEISEPLGWNAPELS